MTHADDDDDDDDPKVIGEGTYGCVTKPSIKCKEVDNKSLDYKNKVSKIMIRKEAMEEYESMREISKNKNINEFIIPQPVMCDPVTDKTFRNTVKKCENEDFPDLQDEDFSILVLEDGGVSLRIFISEIADTLSSSDINVFLTKIHHLMEGLLFFEKRGIIHQDIAARNVVYNIKSGKIRFIDFGLMRKKKNLIEECRLSINRSAKFWDNFPPEYGFANYKKYKVVGLDMDYNLFLERLAYTFDWFSLGRMMKSIVKALFKDYLISKSMFAEVTAYFEKLGEENIKKRDYNIHDMAQRYKTLLMKHDVWLEKATSPSMKSIKIQESFKNTDSSFSSSKKEKENVIDALNNDEEESKPKKSKCKIGFVRNAKTKRCVRRTLRRCRKNYKRNKITRKCVFVLK
jgi:serine/threonine protein kinase